MSATDLTLSCDSIKIIENIYTNLLQNRICKQGYQFYCYTCKAKIINLINVIKHVVNDKEHQSRKQIGAILDGTLSEWKINEVKSVELVYNGIVITTIPMSYCTICSCSLPSINHASDHINGNRHSKSLSLISVDNNLPSLPSNVSQSKNVDLTSTKNTHLVPQVNSSIVTQNETKSETQLCSAYFCNKCLIILRSKAAVKYHIMFHIHQESCSCQINDVIKFSLQNGNKKLINCIVCNVDIADEEELVRHLEVRNHLQKINLYRYATIKSSEINPLSVDFSSLKKCFSVKTKISKKIYCKKCDIICDDENIYNAHINGKRHKQSTLTTDKQTIVSQVVSVAKNNKPLYQCFICNLQFHDINLYWDHNNLESHKNKMAIVDLVVQEKTIEFVYQSGALTFKCQTCQISDFTFEDMINHILSSSHKNKLQQHKNIKKSENYIYSCPVCDVNVLHDFMFVQHIESRKHKQKATSSLEKSVYEFACLLCRLVFGNEQNLLNHFKDSVHIQNRNQKLSNNQLEQRAKLNDINKNSNANSSSCSSSASLYTDTSEKTSKINEKLSNLKLSESTVSLNNTNSANKKKQLNGKLGQSLPHGSTMSLNLDALKENKKSGKKGLGQFNGGSSMSLNTCSWKAVSFMGKGSTWLTDLRNIGKAEIAKTASSSSVTTTRSKAAEAEKANEAKGMTTRSKSAKLEKDSEVKDNAPLQLCQRDRLPRKPVKSGCSDSSSQAKLLKRHGLDYVRMCLEPGEANIFELRPERLAELELSLRLTHPLEEDPDELGCLACNEAIPSQKLLVYEHLRSPGHRGELRKLQLHDEAFAEFAEQYSDLRLAKAYMIASPDTDDELLDCRACDCEVENQDEAIAEHVASAEHLERAGEWRRDAETRLRQMKELVGRGAWYYAQKFACLACSLRFDSELGLVGHLLQKHQRPGQGEEQPQLEVCASCVDCWLGGPESYEAHLRDQFHQYYLKTRSYLAPGLTNAALALLGNLGDSRDALLQAANSLDPQQEAEVLGALQRMARTVYPNAEARICGSRLALVGLPDSKLCVYLDCREEPSGRTACPADQLHELQKIFIRNMAIWTIELPVSARNDPVLSLRHKPSSLSCELSCANELAVEKSKIIRCFNEAFPPCRELILFLSNWSCCCNLADSHRLSTFAISLLVIFYLQTKGILPSVRKLLNLKHSDNGTTDDCNKDEQIDADTKIKQEFVSRLETINSESISVNVTSLGFKELLIDLFLYFANFDYQVNAISPFFGEPIKKRAFVDKNDPFNRYMNTKIFNEKLFRIDCPMYVQDPVDLTQNVTKAISKFQLRSFMKYCSESACKLQK